MDLTQQMQSLARDVGNDYAMSAPEDAASLIRKARRGRVVWNSGVGVVAATGAATLALGGPAVASVITGDSQVEPAGSATESASPSMTPSPTESAEPSESPEPTLEPAGVIDLSDGVSGDEDDDAYDDDAYDDDSYDDDSYDDDHEETEDSEDHSEDRSEDDEDEHEDD